MKDILNLPGIYKERSCRILDSLLKNNQIYQIKLKREVMTLHPFRVRLFELELPSPRKTQRFLRLQYFLF